MSSSRDGISNKISFVFKGAANNPCFTGSPDIDWNVTVKILYVPLSEVSVGVDGKINGFPSYEMYAQVDTGPPVTLFQMRASSDPTDLIGEPDVPVVETIVVALS